MLVCPLWFWTISPSDVDSVPALRIAGLQFPLPSLQHRAHVIARNPAAAARAFQNLINAIFENIFGLGQQGSRKTSAPSFGTNQRRAHRCVLCGGHCVGYFGVTETQGRGALHMHGCLFCTLGPQLLQRCQADPELSSRIASVIDSVVIAGLPDDVHAEIAQRKELGLPPERVGLTAGWRVPSPLDDDGTQFMLWVENVLATTNIHRHTSTCRKGPIGATRCRLAWPRFQERWDRSRSYYENRRQQH